MTFPVTWYHYPVALMPIGAALAIGRRPARKWIAAAIVLADVAIAFLPLLGLPWASSWLWRPDPTMPHPQPIRQVP